MHSMSDKIEINAKKKKKKQAGKVLHNVSALNYWQTGDLQWVEFWVKLLSKIQLFNQSLT